MVKFGRIFLIFFIFVLLIAPLFHVNTAEITEQENRTLAKFPKIIKKKKINSDYGIEFESWLGDRFWGRDKLIAVNEYLRYAIEKNYSKNGVFKGEDGWLFQKSFKQPSSEDVETLKQIKKFCDKNGIKLFAIILPNSLDIYSEYAPKEIADKVKKVETDYLKKLNIPIIVPTESMISQKKLNKLFFKKDHHWTDFGALIAYQDFVSELKNFYPNFPSYNSSDFDISFISQEDYKREGVSINSFCKRIGINYPIFCPSEKYPNYEYKNKIEKQKIIGPWKWGVNRYINKQGYPLKMFLLGKSHGTAFALFSRAYFRETVQVNMNNLYHKIPSIETYLPLVKETSPDILVLLLPKSDWFQKFFTK